MAAGAIENDVVALCAHAARLVETAQFWRVVATGQWLAEVPGYEWSFWALGRSEEEARTELLGVVSGVLQRRLAGGPMVTGRFR